MHTVIDELLIGIGNETLSLLSVEVHPVRGSKVFGRVCVCTCQACVRIRERKRTASLDDETHLMTFLIWFLPKPRLFRAWGPAGPDHFP